jgi:hypothetical protein
MTLTAAVAAADEEGVWEPTGTDSGIVLYRKEVPGSPVIAFRGEGVVDAPMIKVASIILDHRRAPEWMDSLVESRVVRTISDSEYVEFNHFHAPPMVSDRDFVSDVRTRVDPASHSLTLVYRGIEDPSIPVGKRVRGQVISSVFVLTSIEHGQKTRVRAELHVDPKGWLPKFLVNFSQKAWPVNTFKGIRKQATRGDIERSPEFASLLEKVQAIE